MFFGFNSQPRLQVFRLVYISLPQTNMLTQSSTSSKSLTFKESIYYCFRWMPKTHITMSIWHFDSAIILPRGWVFAGKLHIKCSMSNFEIEGFLTHYSNVFLDFSCANVTVRQAIEGFLAYNWYLLANWWISKGSWALTKTALIPDAHNIRRRPPQFHLWKKKFADFV